MNESWAIYIKICQGPSFLVVVYSPIKHTTSVSTLRIYGHLGADVISLISCHRPDSVLFSFVL